MGRGLDLLRSVSNSPGAAVLHGEFRRGLKDLQDVVLHAFPDSKQSRDEANTIANPTQERLGHELAPVAPQPAAAQSEADTRPAAKARDQGIDKDVE